MAATTESAVTPTVHRAADGTVWQEAGDGPALVLVHGVGMNRAVWWPQVERFAGEYRVIAYDMLGHGESPLPPEDTRLQHLATQLTGVFDAAGVDSARLVGHSMGALVALEFALGAPQRVERLVALNAVYERTAAQRAAVLERASRLANRGQEDALEATLERWFEPAQRRRQPDRVARVRHWLDTVDPTGYARVYQRFARADDAFTGRLPELMAPALFATGEFDPNSTPEMSRRMAAATPRGEYRVLPGQRHMMAFADPDPVNELLAEFLRRGDGDVARESRV